MYDMSGLNVGIVIDLGRPKRWIDEECAKLFCPITWRLLLGETGE